MSDNPIFITVKDHSVSGETFQLYRDQQSGLLSTHPKPEGLALDRYYESEDYISHTDGKRSLFEKAYQFVKNIALNKKLKLINDLQPNKGKLLDIGAGTGDFLSFGQKDGWNTIGVEPNEKAKAIALRKNVSFVTNTKSLEDRSFDIITMWHVLEHVPDIEQQISELKRLLKPNGTVIIAVPNYNSYDAKYYGSFWAAYDVPRHLWHFSKQAIQTVFGNTGMKVEKILPMYFDAFYVSLLSEKYKTGHMNFLKAFFIGLKSNLKAKSKIEYSSHIYVIKNN